MLIDLLFPKKCLGCTKEGKYLCQSCIGKQILAKQVCIECEKASIDGITHFKCQKKLGLSGAVSAWKYEGVVRKVLISLKYRFAQETASELAKYCSDFLKANITALPKDAILVPVPLHKSRENWRGFNQSEEIGKLVASQMKWKFIPDFVLRKVKTTPQTELSEKERKQNLRTAFVFNQKHLPLIASGLSLIIFDDVATTGSTLKEVGKVLKRNGFKNVWGLTVAR
ncbi:MAG: ComF family protein [Candidatus Woesebacteria bacterium GW2011_GWA1_37_8]|uniref:ComF family protein n=2 Tax=Candidatus Woeseibacteriota TaxID=1752722 RepID=A0A0G0L333_9BACT|nr:MAG: phosphoribosyltransferase [Microgenomates group bacterium GW2011_GWC1_37_12b]KKQ43815.1 MAG: ComF family protein [Candidatus Woesebacteria bacterium GW2011_GWA1_37_8]KKQ86383.1 MAG: ComF family protein [Candidatus Woesebacteria bacterium GW2011_GWB1_38_8b]